MAVILPRQPLIFNDLPPFTISFFSNYNTISYFFIQMICRALFSFLYILCCYVFFLASKKISPMFYNDSHYYRTDHLIPTLPFSFPCVCNDNSDRMTCNLFRERLCDSRIQQWNHPQLSHSYSSPRIYLANRKMNN